MQRLLFTILISTLLVGCSTQPPQPEYQAAKPVAAEAQTNSELVDANKAIARRYLEALGTPEYTTISEQLLAPEHNLLRSEFENLKYNASDSELLEGSLPSHQAMSDRVNTITRLIGEGDRVVARIDVTGIHSGKFYGVPATNKPFDYKTVAILQLADGKITESWFLANETQFLHRIGEALPSRADGEVVIPPIPDIGHPGDDWVHELSNNGVDTRQNRNKITVVSYNADRFRAGRLTPITPIYDVYLHSGAQASRDLLAEIETVTGEPVAGSFGAAWAARRDSIVNMFAEGDTVVMQFQLEARNTGPMYTLPPSGKLIRSWEILVAEFDGEKWNSAWWFGDELGLFQKIAGIQGQAFLFDDVTLPR